MMRILKAGPRKEHEHPPPPACAHAPALNVGLWAKISQLGQAQKRVGKVA